MMWAIPSSQPQFVVPIVSPGGLMGHIPFLPQYPPTLHQPPSREAWVLGRQQNGNNGVPISANNDGQQPIGSPSGSPDGGSDRSSSAGKTPEKPGSIGNPLMSTPGMASSLDDAMPDVDISEKDTTETSANPEGASMNRSTDWQRDRRVSDGASHALFDNERSNSVQQEASETRPQNQNEQQSPISGVSMEQLAAAVSGVNYNLLQASPSVYSGGHLLQQSPAFFALPGGPSQQQLMYPHVSSSGQSAVSSQAYTSLASGGETGTPNLPLYTMVPSPMVPGFIPSLQAMQPFMLPVQPVTIPWMLLPNAYQAQVWCIFFF